MSADKHRHFVVVTAGERSAPFSYFADAIRAAARQVERATPPRRALVVTVRGDVEVVVASYVTGPTGLPVVGGAA